MKFVHYTNQYLFYKIIYFQIFLDEKSVRKSALKSLKIRVWPPQKRLGYGSIEKQRDRKITWNATPEKVNQSRDDRPAASAVKIWDKSAAPIKTKWPPLFLSFVFLLSSTSIYFNCIESSRELFNWREREREREREALPWQRSRRSAADGAGWRSDQSFLMSCFNLI